MSTPITAVVLTLDEAPNLARVLQRLAWAAEVVVVDCGSTDGTLGIAAAAANVRVVHRDFDSHAAQWNFAVHETGIETEWVLTLDADYVLDDEMVAALRAFAPGREVTACNAAFTYCVLGKPLRGSLYPPRPVLFRRSRGRYVQDGHTQRLVVDGASADLPGRILHDDRKPVDRWLRSQARYAALEAEHIDSRPWRDLGWSARVRKLVLPAPALVFLWCLLVKRGALDGRAGLYYATQRLIAESLLSLELLRRRLASPPG